MNAEMIAALRELEREKGIAFETILAGLEEAMASAYKTGGSRSTPRATTISSAFRRTSTPRRAISAFGSAGSSRRSRSSTRASSLRVRPRRSR